MPLSQRKEFKMGLMQSLLIGGLINE